MDLLSDVVCMGKRKQHTKKWPKKPNACLTHVLE